MKTTKKIQLGLLLSVVLGIGFGIAVVTVKSPSKSSSISTAKEIYQCPMHPQIISDKPGLCPICHMPLQKIESSISQPQSTMEAKSVDGRIGFDIPVERQQLIGVNLTEVVRRPLEVTIQTVGQVAYDPELFTTIEEYRQADNTLRQLDKNEASHDAMERASEVKEAARLRLQLLGLGDSQIEEMATGGNSDTSLVIGKKGMVWVYAQIYESELSRVKPGQVMAITSAAIPGMSFKGVIRAVDSVLNPITRTAKVRAQVRNQKGLLRPQMTVQAVIKIPIEKTITIPPDAIIHTGKRQIVFVAQGEGHFEPREVKVGAEGDNYIEILEGLKAGEKVVTRANFLLDSESRFKAAIMNLTGQEGTRSQDAGGGGLREHQGHMGH